MKILIVSWYFPPTNAIGAVRVGKFARFLRAQGHDVRVLCGTPTDIPSTLAREVPDDTVVRTGWVDVNGLPKTMARLRRRLRALLSGGDGGQKRADTDPAQLQREAGPRRGLDRVLHSLGWFYKHAVSFPDSWGGWTPFALAGARTICRDWSPDMIFASGPPFTAFLVAQRLARRHGVPWVAEYRDRWVDDPYFSADWPEWRLRLLTVLERRLVATAAGVVTVSLPWAAFFQRKFGKPVVAAFNGFDPRDFAVADPSPEPLSHDRLTILYTGVIYAGRRDPTPLFTAINALGPRRNLVSVMFVGTEPSHVMPLAIRAGVADLVKVVAPVPYADSIWLQRRADLLLLLQWNAPADFGHVPAKLFEYLAVRRPIIGLGLEDNMPAAVIRERRAGVFSNDPAVLTRALEDWIDIKQREGRIPQLPVQVCAGMDRDTQYTQLAAFLEERVAESRSDPDLSSLAGHRM
ncbi:glycosyltransferase [Magnetospirillum molischianum]|uniref:Glycosyltransferase subfamily 4-like N-terminal domain-containing protein n=1 Tax=Magnetospirillum molischianum DSM 120 TaxID=1150626 RepID=H8FQA4_MAGML|nr:glycosyltransferase [Magnetospirillum molischianum]CCG40542.1 conserved hypothetical protein [Magnetospirillum molischianum DSM 120]